MCFFLGGRKVRKSTKTTNRRIAQSIYEMTKWEIAKGSYKPESQKDMPFFELVDQFLDKHSKVEKASYKRDKVIGEALKKYFGKTPIGEIRAYDVKAWRKWRSQQVTNKGTFIKKASLNRELAFLKTMFNLAVEWGWLDDNPAEKVKLLRGEEKRLRILDRKEVNALIRCAAEYLKSILILAVSTGMRKEEILGLRWKHIDLANGFIRVVNSKNGDSRNVPLDSHTKDTLLKLRQGRGLEDHVFCRANGERVKCIKEAFKAACIRAGIADFRFHDLRHTAASLLAAGGCDIITLQNILGHKTLLMTQRYAHLMPGRFEKTRAIVNDFWRKGDTKLTRSPDKGESLLVTH
jgi:integrase